MSNIFLGIFNFLMWLPVSVGNHTNYSGGTTGGSTHTYTGGGYTGGSYGGGGGSGLLSSFGAVPTIIILVVVVLIYLAIRKGRLNFSNGGFSGTDSMPNLSVPSNNNTQVVEAIKEHDPNFSKEKFLSWSEQVFVQLQEAWSERDWKKARPFESEELFNLHKSQLDAFIRDGTINKMDNVCVNESFFTDYTKEDGKEYATVFMQTRYNDYIIKEDTKQVVKGDPNTTYSVNYKLKFVRTLGVKTDDLSNKSTHNCPNCGAPVDVNAAGQCAYCGTVITDGTHDWVLCNLDDCGQTQC